MKPTFYLTLMLLLFSAVAWGDTHTFTSDSWLPCNDASYDGFDIIVDGCTVTMDCAHNFHSLTLTNGGVVTHSYAQEGGMNLTVVGNVQVGSGCRIDVTGRGYAPGQGQGNGGYDGYYGSAGGGGYGGVGGSSYIGAAGGASYGSYSAPTDLGSGSNGSGGRGGGAILMTVSGTLTNDGIITASGSNGSGHGGGGSGGSIYLTVGALTGAGSITADGGTRYGGNYGGGGGGGRIAIYYGTNTLAGSIHAFALDGANRGGAGTVYFKQTSAPLGYLLVDNNSSSGSVTPIGGVFPADVTVQGNAILQTPSAITVQGNLHVGSTGTIQTIQNVVLGITVQGSATVDAGGLVTATGYGYTPGNGTGAGGYEGYNASAGGGGYGGRGGQSYVGAAGGTGYGSYLAPTDLGSGSNGSGGAGGGAIRLIVSGTLTLDGTLAANGANGTGHGGGGSGGSVYITTGILNGGGLMTANGGTRYGGNWGGGGGGGRIAVYYDNGNYTGGTQAYGGNGSQFGGAGTIYFKRTADVLGFLTLDNQGNSGAITYLEGELPANLYVYSGTILQPTTALTVDGVMAINSSAQVIAVSGAVLSISVHQTLTLDADGIISANGSGYASGNGTGAGGWEGYNGSAGGGGYGGKGGQSYVAAAGGIGYGSYLAPVDLGSGSNGSGGAGGGAIRIVVNDTFTANGTITANGANGTGHGGGGSGGSVYVTTHTLAGNGVFTANGGTRYGGNWGGGGGGGRIALYYDNTTFGGGEQAYGGNGSEFGGAGTVYLKRTADILGSLTVDNAANSGAATPLSGDLSVNFVLASNAILQPPAPIIIEGQMSVSSGAQVWAYPGNVLDLVVHHSLGLDGGCVVTADGRGNGAASGPGAGGWEGYYGSGGGGGYGGKGGASNPGAAGGISYGSYSAPVDLGSGGNGNGGAAGGGAIHITVTETFAVNGTITANGSNAGGHGGGGSGGSVYVTAATLTGTGAVSANGGTRYGGNWGGGGSGGRIAFHFGQDTYTGTVTACGGNGWEFGGAGTIYRIAGGASRGDMIVDNLQNTGAVTPLSGTISANITLLSGAVLQPPDVLTINGRLHAAPFSRILSVVGSPLQVIVQGSMAVDNNVLVYLSGRGYSPAQGPGTGGWEGYYGSGGGAGHGGMGGGSCGGAAGGIVNDNMYVPTYAGSGGNGSGGAGGGALKVTVRDTLLMNGAIEADGNNGTGHGGGGAGGSVYLASRVLSGSGEISADGGNRDGGNYGGGGGGGLVALWACTAGENLINVHVNGGNGCANGQTGHVFRADTIDTNHNGIPDYCDMLSGNIPDCNNNSVPDILDVAYGVSSDCNGDFIPDECQYDTMVPPTLTVQYGDGVLMLRWNCTPGAATYNLYGKHGSANEVLIANLSGFSYDASALLAGSDPQLWVFRVTGVR